MEIRKPSVLLRTRWWQVPVPAGLWCQRLYWAEWLGWEGIEWH